MRTSADRLAGQLQGVQQGRRGDDRRAVLVVVEHRDAHRLAQPLLDVEALRRLDVLQVDPPESRLEQLHHANELVGILGVDFEIEHVDVGEPLEQDALAFHHRLARLGADVAESQHGRPVADHGDKIGPRRVAAHQPWVRLDFAASPGDARRVGQAQIELRGARLRRPNGDLPRLRELVVVERLLFTVRHVPKSFAQLGGPVRKRKPAPHCPHRRTRPATLLHTEPRRRRSTPSRHFVFVKAVGVESRSP